MSAQVHPSPTGKTKTCCRCGTDLAGQQRLKDAEGLYWCIPCAKEEDKKHRVKKANCPDCGRTVPEDALVPIGLTKVCSRCIKERQAQDKSVGARRGRLEGRFRKEELARIKWLVGVAALLLFISMWRWDLLPDFGGASEVRQLLYSALMLAIVTLIGLVAFVWWVKKRM